MQKSIRNQARKSQERRPRFYIFYSFSSGDAIFEGGWPLSVLPLPFLSHRGDSHTVYSDLHSPVLSLTTSPARISTFLNLIVCLKEFTLPFTRKTVSCSDQCGLAATQWVEQFFAVTLFHLNTTFYCLKLNCFISMSSSVIFPARNNLL